MIQLLIIYRDPISIARPFDDVEINQHNATQRYPISHTGKYMAVAT
jgi:hypothetical protein